MSEKFPKNVNPEADPSIETEVLFDALIKNDTDRLEKLGAELLPEKELKVRRDKMHDDFSKQFLEALSEFPHGKKWRSLFDPKVRKELLESKDIAPEAASGVWEGQIDDESGLSVFNAELLPEENEKILAKAKEEVQEIGRQFEIIGDSDWDEMCRAKMKEWLEILKIHVSQKMIAGRQGNERSYEFHESKERYTYENIKNLFNTWAKKNVSY